jgi:hypothetical protein
MTFISAHKKNEANRPKIETTASKNIKIIQYFLSIYGENSGPFFVFKMAIDHFLERKLA